MSEYLKMVLIQTNEALETIAHTLDTFGHDPELVKQMKKLVQERDELVVLINKNPQ
ncbi:hypothetical protein [Paenibacillus sp. Soil724D2]|uniref:hypothetical protein n=1 Tax=Paenibacillus sp. (strain Soil724D2) TaxID=1736392 RepID=UPI000B28DCC7|nr:hypothetical protein [Paenibacillus sp. Soil724D2]